MYSSHNKVHIHNSLCDGGRWTLLYFQSISFRIAQNVLANQSIKREKLWLKEEYRMSNQFQDWGLYSNLLLGETRCKSARNIGCKHQVLLS